MPATAGRRAYDHRMRDLVCEERAPGLFRHLGVPRSTAVSWIRRGPRVHKRIDGGISGARTPSSPHGHTSGRAGTAFTAADVPNIDRVILLAPSTQTAEITVTSLCITGITFQ